MSEVGTQKDRLSMLLVKHVQASRQREQDKSVSLLMLGRDGVVVRPEATDFTLSRKAANEIQGARTANRHR